MRPYNTHLSNPIHIIPVFHCPPFVACQHACGILTLCVHGGNIYLTSIKWETAKDVLGSICSSATIHHSCICKSNALCLIKLPEASALKSQPLCQEVQIYNLNYTLQDLKSGNKSQLLIVQSSVSSQITSFNGSLELLIEFSAEFAVTMV